MAESLRLAELIAALSLATDLGLGQPMEHHLRACVLAIRLGESVGLGDDELHDVYYVALLRWIGCTSHAHEASVLFGDEIAMRARVARAGSALEVAALVREHLGEGLPLAQRLALIRVLFGGRTSPVGQLRASCEVGQVLADRLGFGPGVKNALLHAFELWNGKGFPNHVRGAQIARPMRLVLLAQEMEIFQRDGGAQAAMRVARERSGASYDPDLVKAFCALAPEQLAGLEEGSAWEQAMAAEPAPVRTLSGSDLDSALEVVADYVDLKSPYTAGHSRGVAALAAQAATARGLPAADARELRRAGLVHDLGRSGVPNSVWDKAGPLSDGDWERVRLHPYLTHRVLSRPTALVSLADLAASHHERLDGDGYHRSLGAQQLPLAARILAAADAYQAMTEHRAFRAPLTAAEAASRLRADVRAGRHDADAVEAVLAAAGHHAQRRRALPAGLTAREVEVLRLIARGQTNKGVARALGISERTASHHVQHVYDKVGVSSRGAAALFAMQHDLVGAEEPG